LSFPLLLLFAQVSFADVNVDSLKVVVRAQKGKERLGSLILLSKQLSYTDQRASMAYSRAAMKLSTELKDKRSEAKALSNIADAQYYLNELDVALKYYQMSRDAAEMVNDKELVANAQSNIAIVNYLWGNLDLAEKTFASALKIYVDISDYDGEANCLNNIGNIYYDQGKTSKATAYYEQALDLKRKTANKLGYVNALTNLGNVFESRGRNDLALKYYQMALASVKKIGNKRVTATVSSNIGTIYMNKGSNDKAVAYYRMALSLSEEVDDQKTMAMILSNLSLIYINQGDLRKAHEYLQRSLKLHESLRDKAGKSKDFYNIGLIFDELKEYQNALDYYEDALVLMKELGDSKGIANVYVSLGNTYANTKDYKKAIKYYNDALVLRNKDNDLPGLAKVYQNIGALEEIMGKDDQAIVYYEKSLRIEEQTGNTNGIAESLINIGTIYKNRGEYARAFDYYKRCEQLARQNNYKRLMMVACKNISEIYMLQDKCQKALDYYIDYTAIKDTLFNEESKRQISEIQTRYETDKRQQEIKLLKKEGLLKEVEIKQKKLWTNALVVFIIVVVVFFLYLFRVKSRANKLLEEKNEKIEEHQTAIIDSINYASKIQNALLPQKDALETLREEFFVLLKPRDIVSGDFYWVSQINGKTYACAADCTGHGVPGAFMSMLGISLLNEAVNRKNLFVPGEILDYMRNEIISLLHQTKEVGIKDGMDIALFCIDHESNQLQYAGAFNSLYIVRDNRVTELKADAMPLAFYYHMPPFTNLTIELGKGDMVYVFSDGYVDQFGGPNHKKFMKRRFKELLVAVSNESAAKQKEILDETIEEWKGINEQTDDIIVVGMKII